MSDVNFTEVELKKPVEGSDLVLGATDVLQTTPRKFAMSDITERGRLFNVIDYGAVPDGVTDSWQAIKDCTDAAIAADSGIVYFPPTSKNNNKHFVTSDTVVFPDRTRVLMDSPLKASFTDRAIIQYGDTYHGGKWQRCDMMHIRLQAVFDTAGFWGDPNQVCIHVIGLQRCSLFEVTRTFGGYCGVKRAQSF